MNMNNDRTITKSFIGAQTIGIANRGILRPGAYADLVIFDPKKMRMMGDFIEPARRPEGIETVIVNGTIV